MGNCCFRSALRVLAVVGAVTALSTASMGQTLKGGKTQPTKNKVKQTAPVKQAAPVKKIPVQRKLASPEQVAAQAKKGSFNGGASLTPNSKNVNPNRNVVGRSGSNDDCSSPTFVSGSPVAVPFDNSQNTTGAEGQNNAACLFFGTSGIENDEWIVWTASGTGAATASICNSGTPDTKMAVYDGSGCPAGDPLACNDDFCGLQSQVTFNVVQGQNYTIQLGRYPGTASPTTGTLTITGPGGGGGGSNDNCADATAIGEGTFNFDTTSATQDGTVTCGFNANADVWFNYTASSNGTASFSTCNGTTMDTVLAVFDSCGGSQITCLDDACGLQTQVTFPVVQGGHYLLRIAGYNGSTGSGTFAVSVSAPATNDNCADAESITGNGPFNFDNSGATTDGGPDPLCLSFGSDQIENDVWFCWTASCNQGDQATLEFCNQTTVDTRVAVYDGCSCSGAILACNDDSCGLQSRVRWEPVPGNQYLIRAGTFPGSTGGLGTFTISCAPAPVPVCTAFDSTTDCQTSSFAIAYNCSNFTVADSYNSNGQAVSSICVNALYFGNAPVPDLWTVSFAEDAGNGVPGNIIDTFTQGTDLTVAGPTPTGDVFVGRDVQEWNLTVARPVTRPAGQCVWVILNNFATGDSVFIMDGDASNGNLQAAQDLNQDGMWQSPAEVLPDDLAICVEGGIGNTSACLVDPCAGMVPPNDDCTGAISLGANQPVHGDTSCATPEGIASCSGSAWANAVWYSATGTGNTMSVDLCASAFYDTRLEVFCGDCSNPVCIGSNDDFCGVQSGLSWCSAPGNTYLIAVHGFGGSTGEFDITLTDDGTPCGTAPECTPCTGIDPDPNGVAEAEQCGEDTNGGCNSSPFAFENITCNATINGQTWASGGTRDTDWFHVVVPASGEVSATVTSDVPAVLFVLTISETGGQPDCTTIALAAQATVLPCVTGAVTATGLAAGSNAYIFVAPSSFDGFACGTGLGNDYVLTVDIGSPCTPPCPCDFNGSGSLNSQDFFDFLSCFFGGGCPAGHTADFNGDHNVNSQDFFDFLSCFFAPPAGCN